MPGYTDAQFLYTDIELSYSLYKPRSEIQALGLILHCLMLKAGYLIYDKNIKVGIIWTVKGIIYTRVVNLSLERLAPLFTSQD